MTNKHLVLAAVSIAVAGTIGVSIARGFAEDDKIGAGGNGDNPYAFGLWGDLPYSTLQATTGVPNLIADMNSQNLAFAAHDGDIVSGSGTCSDSVYTQALGFFNSLNAPAIFTPGDNDWVDCDRQPGFDALTQLDKERALFFSTPFTMGLQRFREEVQATPKCLGVSGPVACVENRRWHVGRVTYATLNIQGSCNNLCGNNPDRHAYIAGNQAEYDARTAANIAWMQDTFAEASAHGSAAVMFVTQADPGFNQDSSQGGPLRDPMTLAETDGDPDGYQAFLLALRAEVIAFKRPVAYVHGDSHYFRIDKPFLNAAGQRLENFTRVETFGDNQQNGTNDVNWLKVLVDPNSREVFAYQPQIVPANRTAVPAP